MVAPFGGGNFVGWEVNAKIGYDFGAFLTAEIHGANMQLGNFYDSSITRGNNTTKPVNPWLAFVCLKWLIF